MISIYTQTLTRTYLCLAISSSGQQLLPFPLPFPFHQMGHLFLLLLVVLVTSTQVTSLAKAAVTEEKSVASMRAMIGSRPPSCEGRCRSCGHCEAVQVPVTPQELQKKRGADQKLGHGNTAAAAARTMPFSYNDHSNYKPLSWRCKCGGLILNP